MFLSHQQSGLSVVAKTQAEPHARTIGNPFPHRILHCLDSPLRIEKDDLKLYHLHLHFAPLE